MQQYADAINQYGPNFPKVQRLAAQQKEVDADLANARDRPWLRASRRITTPRRTTSDFLQEALDQAKSGSQRPRRKTRSVQYPAARRRLQQAALRWSSAKVEGSGHNRRLAFEQYPRRGSGAGSRRLRRGPKSREIYPWRLLVGLVGGIGLALFREYLDNTVKSPDDIESLTGLPSLAVVPSLPGLNGHQASVSRAWAREAPHSGVRVRASRLLSYIQPKSQISEAFRALRTSLLLSQADHPPQVILVTSALPREGKTTAAVNLAVTLAQLGDRTLLMDSDLRKPGIRRALNLTVGKEAGLEFLSRRRFVLWMKSSSRIPPSEIWRL